MQKILPLRLITPGRFKRLTSGSAAMLHVANISCLRWPGGFICPHNFAALLKRWLLGTHQGGVQHVHLDYCLDEFAFRFNRRRSKAKGLLFHRPAQQAVTAGPATYDNIVGNTDSTRPPIALE